MLATNIEQDVLDGNFLIWVIYSLEDDNVTYYVLVTWTQMVLHYIVKADNFNCGFWY